MPDARKSLAMLHAEWEECKACELGVRRELVNGRFVRGEGVLNGVMFIGEGPGQDEEASGQPFVGASGQILRGILAKLNFQDFYITNAVTCRSCSPFTDEQGLPKKNRRGEIAYKDERPIPKQVEACRPRLNEEIYLVDPVVIVALGGTATEALLKRAVTITKERGTTEAIKIPGASHRAVLTEKKGAWVRKSGGAFHQPVEQNMVEYLVIPTLHPAFVARQIADKSPRGAFQLFVNDIKTAIGVYERYRQEVFGDVASPTRLVSTPIAYDDEDKYDGVDDD